ncbi:MAG: hypothetical protein WBW33_13810 [Bryobacteraceae bacterium]
MITPRKAVAFGLGLGLLGALGQIWLIRLNSPQSAALRGMLSIAIAAVIGAVAGRAGKADALKFAGLAGFVAGVVLSVVGLSLLATSPALGGLRPFASVESTLLFVSSILAGSVISSWIVASLALIVALPFSFVPGRKRSE